MKHIIIALGFLVLVVAVDGDGVTAVWGPRAEFQVTFRVVDDEGRPVQGAEFGCNWGRGGFSAPDFGQIHVTTGADGMVVVAGRSVFNEFNFHAEKPGYYPVRSVGYDRPLFQRRANGGWEPWNPTINVVLKRMRNPAPMYVKRASERIPGSGEPVGYDLKEGDWVAPYGRGETSDFVFVSELNQRADRDFDWKLKVSFSNPGDGLQRFDSGSGTGGSALRSPYEASPDGYVSKWTLTRSRRPQSREKSTFNYHGAYFFRVRTVLDAQGNVVKAWYGKIYGDFFDMVYYLNPDGTRNVEFDPKRNLFKPTKPNDSAFWNLAP